MEEMLGMSDECAQLVLEVRLSTEGRTYNWKKWFKGEV